MFKEKNRMVLKERDRGRKRREERERDIDEDRQRLIAWLSESNTLIAAYLDSIEVIDGEHGASLIFVCEEAKAF